jgi:hypothetical protein
MQGSSPYFPIPGNHHEMTLSALKLPRRKAGSWVFDPASNKLQTKKAFPKLKFWESNLKFRSFVRLFVRRLKA